MTVRIKGVTVVSTHSRPKAAGRRQNHSKHAERVSTHSRPKAAGTVAVSIRNHFGVSTHSRPKAAGFRKIDLYCKCDSFNTQPPEGGWDQNAASSRRFAVSTHSRPKAAGRYAATWRRCCLVSTHSRPKAAGLNLKVYLTKIMMFQHTAARRRLDGRFRLEAQGTGFNTQPPEGGWVLMLSAIATRPSFNTQPPEGGWVATQTDSLC